MFDYVVVANGSDSRPLIPYIDGLWDWKGEILHSRWYRRPEAFAGKVSPTSLRPGALMIDGRLSWWSDQALPVSAVHI